MSTYETKRDLNDLNMTQLKAVARKYKVPGITAYKAADHAELVAAVLKGITAHKRLAKAGGGKKSSRKKSSKKKSSKKKSKKSSKKSSKKKTSKKKSVKSSKKKQALTDGLSCDMDQQKCITANKYKKDDIVKLAKKCGVTDIAGKNRKELCAAIEKIMSGGSGSGGSSSDDEPHLVEIPKLNTVKQLESKDKTELLELCEKIQAPCKAYKSKLAIIETLREKQKELVKEHKKSTDKKSTDKKSTPSKNCYGGTMEELQNMNRTDLKGLFEEADLGKAPAKKDTMIDYLCEYENNGKCDPEEGEMCDGDAVCDINAKVCLDKKIAAKSNLDELKIAGKKFIGSKKALDALKKALEGDDDDVVDDDDDDDDDDDVVDDDVVDDDDDDLVVDDVDVVVDDKPSVDKKSVKKPIKKPKHGTEIIDIEATLREIQNADETGLDELGATRAAVLKCLGLMA